MSGYEILKILINLVELVFKHLQQKINGDQNNIHILVFVLWTNHVMETVWYPGSDPDIPSGLLLDF